MAASVSGSPVLASGAFSFIANLVSDGAASAGTIALTNLTDSTRTPTEIQIVPTSATAAPGIFWADVSTLAFVAGRWQIDIVTLAGAVTNTCRLVVRYPHSVIQ